MGLGKAFLIRASHDSNVSSVENKTKQSFDLHVATWWLSFELIYLFVLTLVYRGAVFADATDFDKCVGLWMHALDIKQKNLINTPVAKDVLRFAQVIFCLMKF